MFNKRVMQVMQVMRVDVKVGGREKKRERGLSISRETTRCRSWRLNLDFNMYMYNIPRPMLTYYKIAKYSIHEHLQTT